MLHYYNEADPPEIQWACRYSGTTIICSDRADAIRSALLTDFDKWNRGYETWVAWAGEFYAEDFKSIDPIGKALSLGEYKDAMKTLADAKLHRL